MRVLLRISVVIAANSIAWPQTVKMTPIDGASGGRFGTSVGASGTRVLVGAPGDNASGPGSGSAYIFDSGTGGQLAKLTALDGAAGDGMGLAVALSGTIAVAGAPHDSDSGQSSGSVYIFSADTGQQVAKLIPSDVGANRLFGKSVATDGAMVIVGAPENPTTLNGAAYVFGAVLGQEVVKLTPATGITWDEFGFSVAISGGVAVVGAPGWLSGESGAAYIFDATTGQQLAMLRPANGSNVQFGRSVAVHGGTAVVGATSGSGYGVLYEFDVPPVPQAGILPPVRVLTPCGGSGEGVGGAIALLDSLLVAGSSGSLDEAGVRTGAAFLFDASTGLQYSESFAPDGEADDWFGGAVAASGGFAILGAPGDDDNGLDSGSAYVVNTVPQDNRGAPFCFGDGTGTNCPCSASGNPGEGCRNSSGAEGASLRGLGNASVTSDTFRLGVQGAPGAKPGLILRGANQHAGGFGAPIGDGLLCTSTQTQRSQVQITSNGGTVFSSFQGMPFGATSYGPCNTTNYQFWYRDPHNGCTGAGFNFSNAWTVTWLP